MPSILLHRDGIVWATRPVNDNGESDPSKEASAAPSTPVAVNMAGGPPPVPANLSAAGGNERVALIWEQSPGAATYNLYYSTNRDVTPVNGTPITGIVDNSYTDTHS